MLLNQFSPPALPQPPPGDGKGFFDALLNVLRLFFRQLASTLNTITGSAGGVYIDKPVGVFLRTTDQVIGDADTPEPIQFPVAGLEHWVYIDDATKTELQFRYSGVYSIRVRGRLVSTGGGAKDVYVWIEHAAVNVPYSTQQWHLTGSDEVAVHLACVVPVLAGDIVCVMWMSTGDTVEFEAVDAAGGHPGAPAVQVDVLFQSALPPDGV